jgi:HEPN domain-containing protein
LANNSKSVQWWLKASRQNLQIAKMIFDQDDRELFKFVGFHCQQAAEMAMKGYLTFRKIKFDKTHDLENLGRKIYETHPDLEKLLIEAKDLTPYAVEIRYEDSASGPITKSMATEAIQTAVNLQQAIIDLIK